MSKAVFIGNRIIKADLIEQVYYEKKKEDYLDRRLTSKDFMEGDYYIIHILLKDEKSYSFDFLERKKHNEIVKYLKLVTQEINDALTPVSLEYVFNETTPITYKRTIKQLNGKN